MNLAMKQNSGDDGDVIFKPDENKTVADTGCWKVLIVDDEKDVHAVTELALRNFSFEGKPLQFLHAYTGAEAVQIMADQPDVAVILLDVIMESDDAGLSVATTIRNELNNKLVRIVLRTGQAGLFSEQKVVGDYDINDYKTKAELTAQKLFMTIVVSLRNYSDLAMIDKSHRLMEAKLLSNFADSLKKYRTWKSNENHNRDLEKIFTAHGSQIEWPSTEQFIEGLISQTTALLHTQQNALLNRTLPGAQTHKLELADADDFSEYEFIHHHAEILSILHDMCKHRTLVNFFFNHSFDSLLTSLLDISPDGKTIIFECGSDGEENRKLLEADKINCVSSKNMVNICFILNGVKPVKHQGHTAFLADVPDSLFRLQRREYHRLTVPLVRPLRASIPLMQENGSIKTVQVVLFDISCGGVCLIVANDHNDFKIDAQFFGVRLDLHNAGIIKFDLHVRHIYDMNTPGGLVLRRLSCEFINLPRATFIVIQSYIAEAERAHLTREA